MLVIIKKFLGKRQGVHPTNEISESVEQKVIRIQQGDIRLRNQFLTDYQPYVAKLTSQFCKRYVDPQRDDEFSIALSAFNEAINQFSAENGTAFLSFAQTVVRRRLIDYVRKEQRHTGQIPISAFDVEDDEDHVMNPIESHQAIEQYEKEKCTEDRMAEITQLNAQLSEFGISFFDLVDVSPKHADSRSMLFGIGKTLAENNEMMDILIQKRMLPLKEMLARLDISRKTLERNRKYIITISLIYKGKYPYLIDYLQSAANPNERSENK